MLEWRRHDWMYVSSLKFLSIIYSDNTHNVSLFSPAGQFDHFSSISSNRDGNLYFSKIIEPSNYLDRWRESLYYNTKYVTFLIHNLRFQWHILGPSRSLKSNSGLSLRVITQYIFYFKKEKKRNEEKEHKTRRKKEKRSHFCRIHSGVCLSQSKIYV